MDKNIGYVYILQSKRNNSYYIGSTKNIKKRFEEHQLGKTTYTRNLRPLVLAFSQRYDSLTEAKRVEYKLKQLKRKDIIERIIQEQTIKIKGD